MSKPLSSHNHGGQLRLASQRYGIPLDGWLDLSTGISPWAYPLPPVPPLCWQRLPESDDGLEAAATAYYGSPQLLPVSGWHSKVFLPACLPTRLPYVLVCLRQKMNGNV